MRAQVGAKIAWATLKAPSLKDAEESEPEEDEDDTYILLVSEDEETAEFAILAQREMEVLVDSGDGYGPQSRTLQYFQRRKGVETVRFKKARSV